MTEQPAADRPAATPSSASSSTGTGRGMRLPFRIVWFLAFHLVLWAAFISTANRPSRATSFWLVFLGFVLGVGLMLQASKKLPTIYHGLALFIFMPGLMLLAPWALGPSFQRLVTTPQTVTVLSSSPHDSETIGSSLPLTHYYSYNLVKVRLSDGSQHSGILRPDRSAAVGSQLRLNVDPLGLIKPQDDNVSISAGLILLTLVIAVLAEIEMVSVLVRPEGESFIAVAGRDRQEPS